MTKTHFHKQDLVQFFDDFLKTNEEKRISSYLVSNSNMPGPRGNLELANTFVELVESYFSKNPTQLWGICLKLSNISSDDAPVNDPKEFLTFCGTYAIGAIGSLSSIYFDQAMLRLKESANDTRWRTREAVAMGLQKLLTRTPERTLDVLEGWIENNQWLAMRAVAAGVAEPFLLKNEQIAGKAFLLHKKIFATILGVKNCKSSDFKNLRKGLGYTLSVVTRATPKQGFNFMRELVSSQDKDILWIVRQNLRKKRLVKNFPDEVTSLKKLL